LNMDLRQRLITTYQERFGKEPEYIARAPGRVNLLGEHVDYNDGFVLPAAIDRATYVVLGKSGTEKSSLLALDLGDQAFFDPASILAKNDLNGHPLPGWARYPAGVQWSLNLEELETPGLNAIYASDVPRAAGLSSSASVEMAFAVAWRQLGGWNRPALRLAQICQRAENQYVGVNCGIMDQFASACGVADHALFLDCRSMEWQPVRLPSNVSIVIANTAVQRSLTTSAYNDRRASCEEAVRILQDKIPGVRALRDVSVSDFRRYSSLLSTTTSKRAQHIVEEIARTRHAVELLESRNVARFGKLMDECHASLRDLYGVSCPELDVMVEIARGLPGCYGARLTGAGFGGCTVNLVEDESAGTFAVDLAKGYEMRTGLHPEIYVCRAADGAGIAS
jgi:galactokinase